MPLFPFGPRVVVTDPPGAEERPGLFIPDGAAVDQTLRGIVVQPHEEGHVNEAFKLRKGDLIHYTRGRTIGDVKVVDMEDIVAVDREGD